MITTVSSEDKAALSGAAGADLVIRYDQFADIASELPDAVRAATGGRGVDVVYDGVGKTTFDASLASLAVRGALVLFGGASGQVPAFDLQRLNAGGSLSISRPSLKHFIAAASERAWRSGDIFGAIADGTLDVRIGARFPLADAADAHGRSRAAPPRARCCSFPDARSQTRAAVVRRSKEARTPVHAVVSRDSSRLEAQCEKRPVENSNTQPTRPITATIAAGTMTHQPTASAIKPKAQPNASTSGHHDQGA